MALKRNAPLLMAIGVGKLFNPHLHIPLLLTGLPHKQASPADTTPSTSPSGNTPSSNRAHPIRVVRARGVIHSLILEGEVVRRRRAAARVTR